MSLLHQKLAALKLPAVLVGNLIGRGTHGDVLEVKLDDGSLCAGKRIADRMVPNASPRDQEESAKRFIKACQILSRLSHENVVRFHGVYFDNDDSAAFHLPMLVTERLDKSLVEHLREQALDSSVKVKVLQDVAEGLNFLHSKSVVYCNLTANNVLLSFNEQGETLPNAKLTDVAIADIIGLSHQLEYPDRMVYLPPEVYSNPTVHANSLDVFSFGVLAIHVLLQELPPPMAKEGSTEVERQEEYLSRLEGDPLLPLIKSCLDNTPFLRPSAAELVEDIKTLDTTSPPPTPTMVRANFMYSNSKCYSYMNCIIIIFVMTLFTSLSMSYVKVHG